MGPLVLGIILLLVYWLVPLPAPLPIILLIAGVVALVYGLYVLFAYSRADTRRGRWYY